VNHPDIDQYQRKKTTKKTKSKQRDSSS